MQIVWRIYYCAPAQKSGTRNCDILQVIKAVAFLLQLYRNITYIACTQAPPSDDALTNVWGILQTFGISTLKSKGEFLYHGNLLYCITSDQSFPSHCLCSLAEHL